MIIQNFDLNLIPDSAPVVVHCDQYDRGTGRLVISLYEGSIAYSPSGTAVIQGVKPDGRGFDYNCTLSGNTVTADLTEQMTAVAGQVRTQIVVTESTGRTGTFVFILDVQRSALPADTDMSESDYQLIEQAIEDAQEAVEDSSAWAIGERGGVPVSSGDETYHNNSKYWAEQAAQYAEGGIIFKGSVAFASIPTTGMSDGDMYNITNDFTTDSRFIEGAGKECAAGTNIVWIEDVEKWDIFAMSKIGSLDDLNDVEITTPTSGQVLKYDGSKWVNGAGGSASGDYIGLYGDTLVGSDLNNITSVGNYYNDGTVTVSHYPSNAIITATSSFRLTVEKMGDSASTNLRQTYVLDNSVDFVFERHRTSGNWSSWQKVLTSYSNIGELDNVDISSPTNNQVLTYNSTTQKWENANAQGGSGDYVGLYGMTEIQSSDGQGSTVIDLDTYTSVGNYYCNGKGRIQPRYNFFDNNQSGGQSRDFPDAVFVLVVKKLPNNNLTQELTICTDTNQTSAFFRLIRYKGISGWTYWARQGSTTAYGIYLTVNGIHDTSLSSLATNDLLVYNNTNLKWENKPVLNDLYKANGILGAKNLLPNNATSRTINGVTFTVNSDGSITVNGTATNTAFFYFLGDAFNNSGLTLNGTYKISSKNYISNVSYLRVGITNGAYENITEEKEVTFNNNDIYAAIRINSGEVVSNVTLYPMIRLATDTDDTYVPYAMTNRELTEKVNAPLTSGTITATALSGWTTIKTIQVDSNKRYLVVFGAIFSDGTSNVYRGVQINTLNQTGVISTGSNVSMTAIISGVSSIELKAYQATGGTCTGTYQILEV